MKIKKVKKEELKDNKNLFDIVDRTRNFSIMYSGVEPEPFFNTLYECGIRNFLMSYYYILKKKVSMDKRFGELDGVKLFVDSGAYSYRSDSVFIESKDPIKFFEDIIHRYLNWAKKYKKYIFAIANLDVEGIIDPAIVDKWNKEYFEPFMLETGIPVCFVWHPESYQSWEYYCKRYPYVGLTAIEDESFDKNKHKAMLKEAEKNGSVVHGFGMTRTSALTELPYYTVDSTSWNVGMQYGEVNYWTGSKMSRLKKEDWKYKKLDYFVNRYHLDKQKLLDEDLLELIRINIYAFKEAETYINTKLKSMLYWLKAKAVKIDIDNAPEGFFPPRTFDPENIELAKEYAKKMNINPDYDEGDAGNVGTLVYDANVFIHWDDPVFKTNREWYLENDNLYVIDALHDKFINRVTSSLDEKVQDLIHFFRECVSGESDKLLQLGTNFDRIVKERENYISEDDEFEEKEISKEELELKLANILPAPGEGGDKIADIDKETFERIGITPYFDSSGKLIKGTVSQKKPTKFYSRKFPKLACDTCFAAQKCPEYKPGYVCAYHKLFQRYDTRNMADIINAMQGMVELNLERLQRAAIIETVTGLYDNNVNSMITQNMNLLTRLKEMYEHSSNEVLRQTRVYRPDGTQEQTTEVTNPQAGSILEKLFSNITLEDEPKEEVKKKGEAYTVNEEDFEE